MGEPSFAAAILLWGLLPGLLLLWLADVDWSWVERAAAAPGLSLAIVAFAAYAAEIAGLSVRPVPVLALVAVICAIAFALRRVGTRVPRPMPGGWPDDLPKALWWAPWLVWLAPLVIVAQLQPLSIEALLPPTLHDGLDHANWFRLIYETGSLNPHVVLAPPLNAAGEPTYYPWGMHAWLALVAHTTSLDPVAVLMRGTVMISAAVPLSVYVFTAGLTGRGWTAMAAAMLSLFFWWVPYQIWAWGGYPLLAGAIAALPVSRLAMSAFGRRHVASIVACAICLAGVLLIHPSQLFVVLIMSTLVMATLAAGGVVPWRAALPFVAVFGAAGVVLVVGGRVWQPLADFLEKATTVGAGFAGDPRYRWPIGTMFDTQQPLPGARRIGVGMLAAIGGIAALFNARLRPLLVLHLVFGGLVLMTKHQTWLTTLWYHIPERIWYAQMATVPALGAVGIGAGVHLLTRVARRWIDLSRSHWQLAVWAVALWAVFTSVNKSFEPWATWRLYHVVHRNPHLSITDRRVLADYSWMRANIPRGELIFNAPADWGLPLPFTGNRTVFWSGGYAVDPATKWNDFVALMRRGDPFTSRAGAELSALGINYVYAARLSPALEEGGRLPLDTSALRGAAGFEVLYESPTAMVLRVRDAAAAALLGLRDSDRLRFEGFYRLEQIDRSEWRWTAGRGLLFINTAGLSGSECFVRVLGPSPDDFRILHRGAPLEYTGRGHRLVRDGSEGATINLEIVSSTHTLPPPNADDRVLGVKVTNIAFTCGG